MRTARLPTVHVLVAATRCQSRGNQPPPSGHTYPFPLWTYSPLLLLVTHPFWTYPTPGTPQPSRHTQPNICTLLGYSPLPLWDAHPWTYSPPPLWDIHSCGHTRPLPLWDTHPFWKYARHCEQADTCENNTLPELLLRVVKMF